MRKNKKTPFIFITVFLLMFIASFLPGTSICADQSSDAQKVKKETKQEVSAKANPYADAEITIKIIPSIHNTFGYDILLHGKPLVHQPHIPGLPGNDGFTTKERAKTVAEFVVKKIRKNEMPPTVTVEDLNSMKVLK